MAAPLCLTLSGALSDVLLVRGYLEAINEDPQARRVQFVRYFCGDARLARLVRIELETSTGKRSWTPIEMAESLQLEFDLAPGERLTARLIRSEAVDTDALPEPFPSCFVRLEVIG